MKHFLFVLLFAVLPFSAVAQTSLEEYCAEVFRHSQTMGIARAEADAAEAEMRRARKGFLPSLVLYQDMTYAFRKQGNERRFAWSMRPEISQTVYGGGVRAAAKQAEALYGQALSDEQSVDRDVCYEAEVVYWSLSRAESYRRAMADYLLIVGSLREVVARRFEEGYTAKGDLLQIESRMSDAEYQYSAAEQEYLVALHNFNVLRGEDASLSVTLTQSILDTMSMPRRESAEAIIARHPDYKSSLAREEYARWGIKLADARFSPSMSAGVYGVLQPNVPNVKGAGVMAGGGVVFSFTTPIYHFGERRQAARSAQSRYEAAQLQTVELAERILLDESNQWTRLVNTQKRVDAVRRNLALAAENLEISTYSYNEGLSTVLDVLQAQISWLQIYTNAITAQYDYAVAIAAYRQLTETMP